MADYQRHVDLSTLFQTMQAEAAEDVQEFPLLSSLLTSTLLQADDLASALGLLLARHLALESVEVDTWYEQISRLYRRYPALVKAAEQDLLCQLQANAAIKNHYTPLLYFAGFHALQCHRLAHHFWHHHGQPMALYIQSRILQKFSVDVHPAAQIGVRIFMDHAVGIVIGETAVIEDDVTLFQGVTLGGTGKASGDRHPKIRQGAFIGCGAQILGNIEVGPRAKVGAGAVVVKSVAAGDTVLGPVAKPYKN